MKNLKNRIVVGFTVATIGIVGFAAVAGAGDLKSFCDDQGNTVLEAAPSWAAYAGSLRITSADDGSVVFDGPGGSWSGKVNPAASYSAVWYDLANEWEGGVWGSASNNTPECEPLITEVVVEPEPEGAIDLTVEEPAPSTPVVTIVTETGTPVVPQVPVVTIVTTSEGGGGEGELPATGRNTDLILLLGVLFAGAGIAFCVLGRRPATIA